MRMLEDVAVAFKPLIRKVIKVIRRPAGEGPLGCGFVTCNRVPSYKRLSDGFSGVVFPCFPMKSGVREESGIDEAR